MLPYVVGGRRLGPVVGGEEDLDDDNILDLGVDPIAAVGF